MKKLSKYIVTITASNPAGETLNLKYQIYDNSLLERWIALMKNQPENVWIEGDGHFYGRQFHDEKQLEEKINDLINQINFHLLDIGRTDKAIYLLAKKPMSGEFLNRLHSIFEQLEPDRSINNTRAVNENLQSLNIAIHQAEQFLYKNLDNEHIQVQLMPAVKLPLENEDYNLFDLDYEFGTMYLTYGQTGVPTKDAFINKSKPTPQQFYSNGMYLCFFENRKFTQLADFKKWLTQNGMSFEDKKLALGYIPLGKLISPLVEDKKAFIKTLKNFNKIAKVSVSEIPNETAVEPEITFRKPLSETHWPSDPELLYHLDYCPYLDLQMSFDAKALLLEAQKALSYFVVHRDYDQSSSDQKAKWKSLGLRSLFGDYTKTEYHTSYQFEGDPVYSNTVFAKLCPQTIEFLNTITDMDKCERIRFMLLEPGARINVHRDSQDRDVCLAVNISLNMPEGCAFKANLNFDGSANPYSVNLPFRDSGSVILFNNAKYHTVENLSSVPRIHIIFHGPVKFDDKTLLNIARKQNQIFTREKILSKLAAKKKATGESFDKSPGLTKELNEAGLL